MTKTILLLIIALTMTATGMAATAPDADSLLVESVGGVSALDAIRTLTGYRAYGRVDLSGMPGQYRELFLPPDKLFMEIKAEGVTLVQAYDGQTAWQQDHNGRASKLAGFERRELLKSLYLESFSYLLPDRMEGGAEYIGDTTIGYDDFHQVAVYPLRRDTVIMLLDATSARKTYLISRLDAMANVTEFDDYRDVGGILMPFMQKSVFAGTPVSMLFQTDSVMLDNRIDPGIFAMPGVDEIDFRFDGHEASVTVPFWYYRGHIWIEAEINGTTKAWFLLDSGASANLFHGPTVAPLGLPEVGSMPAMGLGGFESVALVETDSISIGSLALIDQVAGSFDLSPLGISPGAGKTTGGILGHDFLSRFPVLVNYRDSTLTVFDPARFTPPEGGIELPFHLTMLVPTVEAEVQGVAGNFIIDLGNAFGLVLHERFFENNRLDTLLESIETVTQQLSGVGGRLTGRTATVPKFRFGEILLSNLPTVIPASGQGLADSQELAGNIGNMILEHFEVLFDYEHARLILYDTGKADGH